MLLRFVGENIRSFRDRFELSLAATTMAEAGYVREVPWNRDGATIRVLPTVGIFGSNASGKTNVLKALDDMRRLVLTSFQQGTEGSSVQRIPFLLDAEHSAQPSLFEIDAIIEGVRHVYGFECDNREIRKEWAYHYPRGRRALLFSRDAGAVNPGVEDRDRGRDTSGLVRSNALLASTGAATGYEPASRIFRFFNDGLMTREANETVDQEMLLRAGLQDPEFKTRLIHLMSAADTGIVDARMRNVPPELRLRMQEVLKLLPLGSAEEGEFAIMDPVELVHQAPDARMALSWESESKGTVQWLHLLTPVLMALDRGSLLAVDELDSSLHPHLVSQIIRLFQDPRTNPRGAQLVFNAFDHSILALREGRRLLGRDQVWFTEKDNDGSTRLFPLADWSPRKDEAIDERYLRGRYGGVPIVLEDLLEESAAPVS